MKNRQWPFGAGRAGGGQPAEEQPAACSRRPRSSDGGRVFRTGLYAGAVTAAVLAAVVLINLLVRALPARYTQFDLSANGLYTLGDTSKQLVQGLADDVTIYYLAQAGSEDSYLTKLLDQYAAQSSRLTWQQKDPAIYPTFAAQYDAQNAGEGGLIVVCGERSAVIAADDLYAYDYSDYYTTGTYDVQFDGENQVTTAIYNVTSGEQSRAYYTTNHNEYSLDGTLADAIRKQNIGLTPLNLLNEEIPADCDLLIVNLPQSDFMGADGLVNEAAQLADYLAGGGRLLLITDAYYDTPNLDAAMAQFGLARVPGIVVEGDSSYCVASSYAGAMFGLPGETCLLPDLAEAEASGITEHLGGAAVLLPIAQGIAISETEGITAEALLTTSDLAYSKAAGYGLETVEKEEGDIDGPFAMAAWAMDNETGAQAVWVSCGNIGYSSADTAVNGGNSTFLLGCAAAMTGQSSDLLIAAKSLEGDRLTISSAAASLWGGVFQLALPAALLALGAVITLRRRRR